MGWVNMSYVFFIDESGDHNLQTGNENFPIFCLAGCIFEQEYYKTIVRPVIDDFKKRFIGRTDVILHSSEIRRQNKQFHFLSDAEKRKDFYEGVNQLILSLDFKIIAAVILKDDHKRIHGESARNPYHVSLEFLLDGYSEFLNSISFLETGYMMSESRGKKEDQLLKKEYFSYKNIGTEKTKNLENITSFWMEKKHENIAGLQIADLIAYPIASKILRPRDSNPAFNILRSKFFSKQNNSGMQVLDAGIKIYPATSMEHLKLFEG